MTIDVVHPSSAAERPDRESRFRVELPDGGFADCEMDSSFGIPAVDVQWVDVPEEDRGKGAALWRGQD